MQVIKNSNNQVVIIGGNAIQSPTDLSSDTVTSAADIAKGKIAHLNNGTQVTGTLEKGGIVVSASGNAYLPAQGLAQINVSITEITTSATYTIRQS